MHEPSAFFHRAHPGLRPCLPSVIRSGTPRHTLTTTDRWGVSVREFRARNRINVGTGHFPERSAALWERGQPWRAYPGQCRERSEWKSASLRVSWIPSEATRRTASTTLSTAGRFCCDHAAKSRQSQRLRHLPADRNGRHARAGIHGAGRDDEAAKDRRCPGRQEHGRIDPVLGDLAHDSLHLSAPRRRPGKRPHGQRQIRRARPAARSSVMS